MLTLGFLPNLQFCNLLIRSGVNVRQAAGENANTVVLKPLKVELGDIQDWDSSGILDQIAIDQVKYIKSIPIMTN